MQITSKTTKEQMTKYLGENAQFVKEHDKNLFDRVAYTSKMYKKDAEKVTKSDLASLVKEVASLVAMPAAAEEKKSKDTKKTSKTEAPKAENSVKPTGKKLSAKKSTETEEVKSEKTEEKTKVDTKKSAKETPKKESSATDSKKGTVPSKPDKKKVKESAVTPTEFSGKTDKTPLLAEVFKDEFDLTDDDGTTTHYEIAHDIKNMDDLYKALENDDSIVFAMYWAERHLKQFPYFDGKFKAPKSFPMDIDLATCLYASDAGTCAYALSVYSEGMYLIFPDELTEYNGLRFSNGIEFQIYRVVEE